MIEHIFSEMKSRLNEGLGEISNELMASGVKEMANTWFLSLQLF